MHLSYWDLVDFLVEAPLLYLTSYRGSFPAYRTGFRLHIVEAEQAN